MGAGAIVGIVIAAVVVLLVLWFVVTYNSLTRLKVNVDEAFSSMDVSMKKRYDLIPNVVNTVKGYAKHEKSTLSDVVELRNKAASASTPEEKIKADGAFAGAVSKLFALVENYPELKADSSFKDLQNTLSKLEDEISSSRRYYNAVVKSYNIKIRVFPSNIVAGMFKFEQKPMYEVEDASERKNVDVQF